MIILEITILLIIVYIILTIFNRKRYRKPPGPWCMPVFGYWLQIGRRPHLQLMKLREKYGDIMSLRIGQRDAIVLNGYEIITEAYCNHSIAFAGRPDFCFYEFAAKQGSFTFMDYCLEWRLKRKSATRAINSIVEPRFHSENYVSKMEHICKTFSEQLLNNLGKPYDPKDTIDVAVCSIMDSFCFGNYKEKLDVEYIAFKNFQEKFNDFFSFDHFTNSFPWTKYIFAILFLFFQKENKKTQSFFEEKINQRINNKLSKDINCIVDYLQDKTVINDSTQKKKHLLDIVGDIIGAGIATTGTQLKFIFLYLIVFPEWQIKIQTQIDGELSKSDNLKMDDVDKLSLLHAFILEVERYACLAPFLLYRSLVKDTIFRSYFIPEGTLIIPNVYSAHFDKKVWVEPQNFNPYRFLTENGTIDVNMETKILLFGAGSRRCVGQHVATKNMLTVVGHILKQFSLKPVPGEIYDITASQVGSLFFVKPYKVIFDKR